LGRLWCWDGSSDVKVKFGDVVVLSCCFPLYKQEFLMLFYAFLEVQTALYVEFLWGYTCYGRNLKDGAY